MKRIINSDNFKKIFKFGVVGGLAFIIDYTLLYVLTEFGGLHELLSAFISFTISLIFNYILSVKWVFDVNKKQTHKEVVLFVVLSVIGLLMNEIIIFGGNLINVHYMISKLFATVVVMIFNFITRKKLLEN